MQRRALGLRTLSPYQPSAELGCAAQRLPKGPLARTHSRFGRPFEALAEKSSSASQSTGGKTSGPFDALTDESSGTTGEVTDDALVYQPERCAVKLL